jgi:bacteriorhodopsin
MVTCFCDECMNLDTDETFILLFNIYVVLWYIYAIHVV